MHLQPYLFFKGDCEAAFKFYERCLGGKIEALLTHAGTPAEKQVPAEWRNKIMHARLVVGDAVLMGSDVAPEHHKTPQGFSVTIHVTDPSEAERVFRALADNGNVTMPLGATFWAQRFGMLVDRFGTPWMVNCPLVG